MLVAESYLTTSLRENAYKKMKLVAFSNRSYPVLNIFTKFAFATEISSQKIYC